MISLRDIPHPLAPFSRPACLVSLPAGRLTYAAPVPARLVVPMHRDAKRTEGYPLAWVEERIAGSSKKTILSTESMVAFVLY